MSIRPLAHLKAVSKRYPKAWFWIEKSRQSNGKNGLPAWPDWCFCPSAGFQAVATFYERFKPAGMMDVNALSALGTWRMTQGIYRFDKSVEKALIMSPISGNLPVEVFYRLPEWCMYVEANNDIKFTGEKLHGFYSHLDYDFDTEQTNLILTLDLDSGFFPVILSIGSWSVLESISNFLHYVNHRCDTPLENQRIQELSKFIEPMITPLISLLLYLCSETPEYSGGTPSFRRTTNKQNKWWGLNPPKKPKIIEVGKTLGISLRTSQVYGDTSTSGRSVSPHIRRGHWHGYWVGKKKDTDQPRRFIYRWIPQLGVNTIYLNETKASSKAA